MSKSKRTVREKNHRHDHRVGWTFHPIYFGKVFPVTGVILYNVKRRHYRAIHIELNSCHLYLASALDHFVWIDKMSLSNWYMLLFHPDIQRTRIEDFA